MSDEQWAGVPVAWASVAENGQPLWLGYDRPIDATAVPLYRHPKPTLTDAEREAVRFCVTASLPETEKLGGVVAGLCRMHAATLRGLLDRMSGGGDCPDADKAAKQDNSGLRNGTVDGEK